MQKQFQWISKLPDDINGNYILTYYPNTNWLEDSARVYPVVIDPIIGVTQESWVEDVSVTFEHPNNNFYTDTMTMSYNGIYYDENTGDLLNANGTYETSFGPYSYNAKHVPSTNNITGL